MLTMYNRYSALCILIVYIPLSNHLLYHYHSYILALTIYQVDYPLFVTTIRVM